MARSVRIDEALVRWCAEMVRTHPGYGKVTVFRDRAMDLDRVLARLDRAPTKARPKRNPSAPERAAKYAPVFDKAIRQTAKAEKRERRAAETAGLWKQAMARSGGCCECGCGRAFHEEGENKPEMDHEASRRVPQTITNVWMLALHCHRMRQGNRPSERYWLGVFLVHCLRHGYAKEAARVQDRIDVVEVKGALPAAPRVRP